MDIGMGHNLSQRNQWGAGGEYQVHFGKLRFQYTSSTIGSDARHFKTGADIWRAQSARQIAKVKAPSPSVLRIAPNAIPGSAAATPDR